MGDQQRRPFQGRHARRRLLKLEDGPQAGAIPAVTGLMQSNGIT